MAIAQQGQEPTFAIWTRVCLVAEWAREVVPTRRTNRNPAASDELEASSKLYDLAQDKPNAASVIMVGG